ncbi:hypothetical protein F5887DRAFT_919530 [Amanita rubescens]|nr:hypothetical protein F5887DRAFT_919530 [Amanita rubescens]
MSSKKAELQAKLAAIQKEKEERERWEKEWLTREMAEEEAREAEEAAREAKRKKKEEAEKKLAAERRKREEERKRASEAEKAEKAKTKAKGSVKPRPKDKGKEKAREGSPMDLATNLEQFGDGPSDSEDAMLLAMEASRNQAETDRVRKKAGESSKGKRKTREPSVDEESSTKERFSCDSCIAKGQVCEEPVGRASTCPACQRSKTACKVNGVRRGDLGKVKRRKVDAETGGDMGAILSIFEKMLEENREFHKAVLAEFAANRKHNARVQRLLTEVADPTYAYTPPSEEHVAEEWRPITVEEIEFTNRAMYEIEKAGKVPAAWEYTGPGPVPDSQDVWNWFHRKGVINRQGRYLGGHRDLLSKAESEEDEEVEVIEVDGPKDEMSGAANEVSESGGPSGPSIDPVTESTSGKKSEDEEGEKGEAEETGDEGVEGEERDPEVRDVEKGVGEMVVD